jgi:hypothetical protein
MVHVTAAGLLEWTLVACVLASWRVKNRAQHCGKEHMSPDRVAMPGVSRTGILENAGAMMKMEFWKRCVFIHSCFARVIVGHGFPRALN